MKERHLRNNWTGKVIGDFTVVRFDENSPKHKYRWICRCNNCGEEKSIDVGQLYKSLDSNILRCKCNSKYKCPHNKKGYKEDFTGRRFGSLVVRGFAYSKNTHSYWYCDCDCGNKNIVVNGQLLKNGKRQSCNNCTCKKPYVKDLSGQRFGNLIVKSLIGRKNNKTYWKCICDCGNTVVKSSNELKRAKNLMCDDCKMNIKENEVAGEIWHDIKGYEGLYQAGNLGDIRSLNRFFINPNGTKCFCKGKILNQTLDSGGRYLYITLCKNGKQQKRLSHILIAESFLGERPSDEYEVDHINNNPRDNRVCNLQWLNHIDNIHKSYDTLNPIRNYTECALVTPSGDIRYYHSIKDFERYCKTMPLETLPFRLYPLIREKESNGYQFIRKGEEKWQIITQ